MRSITILAVLASLGISACHRNSDHPTTGNPPPQIPKITLKVQGPTDNPPSGYTPAPPVNNLQYYCQFSGGNLPGGNGGDVQFSQRVKVTFPVHLDADKQFSIKSVGFPVDPKMQLSVFGQITSNQAEIQDTNDKLQTGEYAVQVTDSSHSTTFDCDPKVINN